MRTYNMSTEDIIESLNLYIEEQRRRLGVNIKGHLVVHKVIDNTSSFKAYKNYKYSVYYIQNRTKHALFGVSLVDKVIGDKDEAIVLKLNIELCKLIFKAIKEGIIDEIIKGEYNGNNNE